MKTENINSVIERLISSDMQAILISGAWGIGKTYNIKEFIKNNQSKIDNKELKIAYTSLFGKKSLDEVNTELYQTLNPSAKILNVISNVAKLVNFGVGLSSGLNINLDGEQINTRRKGLKVKNKTKSLIIIDDFERKSDNITAEDLLGYINYLINQGFKIVVLADLETKYGKVSKKYEIGKLTTNEDNDKKYIAKVNWNDDILGFYKEKIFDRIYKITETPIEVINTIFKENIDFITPEIINELDNNIRMAIKANSLFKQVENYIKQKRYGDANYGLIMKICVYAVNELMTSKYSHFFEEECKESEFLNYSEKTFENIITNYDQSITTNRELIGAINNIYLNEDYNLLNNIYCKNNDNIFDSCFYASDKNKINLIKKQLGYLYSIPKGGNYSHSLINGFIRDWYCYCSFLDISFIDKNTLFSKLHELNFRLDAFGESNKEFIKIIEEYNKYRNEKLRYDIEDELNSKDLNILRKGFYDASRNLMDDKTRQHIVKILKQHNFYLQDLTGDITYEIWETNHLICQIIAKDIPECKTELLNLLKRIQKDNKTDLSCNYRINSLIRQYGLDK